MNLHGPDACAGANVDNFLRAVQYRGSPSLLVSQLPFTYTDSFTFDGSKE